MNVLIIVDMLNDFMAPGGALYLGDSAREIIPFVAEKIKLHRSAGDKILYVCDSHKSDDREFKMFAPHCVKDTKGAQIINELKSKEDDIIVRKTRYSAFYGTELGAILKKLNPVKVYVAGVCTSVCVMDTTGDLRNRDYDVKVYKNGTFDFDKEAHLFALKRMEKIYGAKVE